ncbi:TPA: hypothetical protein DEO28_01985 [Candidatus Dependentiae bacterium]|nr:hypothetical protein [Candidatus Dependentiae bacterium]HBZ73260.1 hypothetical protein [Candidatus Dependentiae bacterium]
MKNMSKIIKFTLLGFIFITNSINAELYSIESAQSQWSMSVDSEILSVSPVLQKMMSSGFRESINKRISLTYSKQNIIIFLSFLNKIHNKLESELLEEINSIQDPNILRDLFLMSDFFQVAQLKELLYKSLAKILCSQSILDAFKQNPEAFAPNQFLPSNFDQQLANKIKAQIALFSNFEIPGHRHKIIDAKIENNFLIVLLDDHAYRICKINDDSSLQPLIVEIPSHRISATEISEGFLIAKLENDTFRIWKINDDLSLQRIIIETAGHQIIYATIKNGFLIATLEDDTCRIWKINGDLSLQPIMVEIAGHQIIYTNFENGFLITTLEDYTCRIWKINDDYSVQPIIIEAEGHRIMYVKIEDGFLIAGLDNNTYKIWKINDDTSLQPIIIETDGHQIIRATIEDGFLIAHLENETYKIWKIHDDYSLQPIVALGHRIKQPRIKDKVLIAELDDTPRIWKINDNSILQPIMVEIPGHQIKYARFENGFLITTLEDYYTEKIWKINDDLSLQPVMLDVDKHHIRKTIICNQLLITQLDDYTYKIFTDIIPKQNLTSQQMLFIKSCMQEPIYLESNPEFKTIFDSLTPKIKQVLLKKKFVRPSIIMRPIPALEMRSDLKRTKPLFSK